MAITVTITNGTTSVDLTSYLQDSGIVAPPPGEMDRTRIVDLPLAVTAASADALWLVWNNIEAMLVRARKASGVYGQAANVELAVTLDTTYTVYFDVLDGAMAPTRYHALNDWFFATLSLVCLPYGRGAVVTESATSTLTNGAATWLVSSIPGDVPALARLTIEDVSTSTQVINGVHVYQRSHHALTSGHFDPLVELTAATPGVATTDSSSYSSSNFARLIANASWRTIAEVTRPTGDYNNGLFDLWLRVRDSSTVTGAPSNVLGSAIPEIYPVNTWTNSAAGSDTTIAATIDPSPTSGNILVAVVGYEGNTTPTTPTGFTLSTDGVDNALVTNTGPTPDVQVAVYWKVSDGTETTVSCTTGTATNRAIWVREYENMDATPVEQVAADATGNDITPTTNSITTTQAYQLLVAAAYSAANGAYTGAWGSSFQEQYDSLGLAVATRLVTSATSYSTNVRTDTGQWAATLVSLQGVNTTAPNLTATTYSIAIVAVSADGSLSPASEVIQRSIPTNYALPLTWDAPDVGTVDDYRVYFNRGTGWKYFAVGSATTSYTLRTESGATTETIDYDGSAVGLFRVQVALDNGVTLFTGPSFTAPLTDSTWADVLAGTFPLPPIPALDAGTPPDWLIRVQGKHDDASPNLDVDVAWLVPHDEPQLIARSTGYALGTKRDWVIDQRRDGRVSGRLYEDGTTTDAGQVDTIGQLTVGPGATQIALRLTGEDGVSDVDDLKCIATLRYVPRFKWLRGT